MYFFETKNESQATQESSPEYMALKSSNNKEQLIKNMEGFGVEMSSYTEPESEDQEALALIEGRGNIEQIAQASIESENTGNTDSNDQSNTVRIDEEINADWIGEGGKPGM